MEKSNVDINYSPEEMKLLKKYRLVARHCLECIHCIKSDDLNPIDICINEKRSVFYNENGFLESCFSADYGEGTSNNIILSDNY